MDARITIDACGDSLEVSFHPNHVSELSVLITPGQWAALVDQAEQLRPMAEYRRRRSVEAAKEAAGHANRGAA